MSTKPNNRNNQQHNNGSHSPRSEPSKPAVQASAPAAPTPAPTQEPELKFVTVRTLKPYAPIFIEDLAGRMVEQDEIKQKVPAGSTIKVTAKEGNVAIAAGVVVSTGNVFEE